MFMMHTSIYIVSTKMSYTIKNGCTYWDSVQAYTKSIYIIQKLSNIIDSHSIVVVHHVLNIIAKLAI